MIRKIFLLSLLLVFLAGCTLTKGLGGAGKGFCDGAKQGASEDVNFIKKADAWVKDHMW